MERVDSIKYLSIHITKDLTWEDHITKDLTWEDHITKGDEKSTATPISPYAAWMDQEVVAAHVNAHGF